MPYQPSDLLSKSDHARMVRRRARKQAAVSFSLNRTTQEWHSTASPSSSSSVSISSLDIMIARSIRMSSRIGRNSIPFVLILIERVDFALEMGRDRVASQFAVRRQQPALDCQRLPVDVKSVDALVMRQLGVDCIQGLLDLLMIDIAG